jgi:predicted lipid-binding transport protein (Tim44 family)
MSRLRLRPLIALLAVAAVLIFLAVEAGAAPRMNSGSRGTRTYSAPPPTTTAPNAASPIERSMTKPGQPGTSIANPATPASQPGGFFNRPGLLGGLAAGFLGAGLIGLLLGHGFMGGLAGLASFIGLVLQVGLVAMVGMLAWRWWQRRSQPAAAFAGGPAMREAGTHDIPRSGLSGGSVATTPIEIKPEDYDAFERTLGEIQTAYSNEDLSSLRLRVTPEMLSYYAEELAANASHGVVNKITAVKLLNGDLSEAWREGDDEYATVAMRYQQIDKTIERASGRLVEGGDEPDEGVEYWTFRRSRGNPWIVSAIQQTN